MAVPAVSARILVVEDEPFVAEQLTARLEALGHRVVGRAGNAQDALDLAAREAPDLVLMDIVLEGERDGIWVAAELLRDAIPVIFLTAHADDERLARARLTEPLAYLVKPVADAELRAAVEVGLYRHRVERELARLRDELAELRGGADGRARSARQLLDHLPGMAYRSADVERSRLLEVSAASWTLLGRAPEALAAPGFDFRELIHPADREACAARLAGARGQPVSLDYRLASPDGGWQPVREWASPAAGGLAGLIMPRLALEGAAHAGRTGCGLAERIIDSLPLAILLLDAAGRIVRFNPFMERLGGRPLASVRGRDWFECFVPEPERLRADFLAGGIGPGRVVPLRSAEGACHELEWYEARLPDAAGEVLVVGLDVTERRRMAEVQRVAGLGYWEWDIPGNHLVWSDEVYAIFGLDRADFRESYEAFLERVHPGDRAAVMAAVEAALADGRPCRIDHRILLPDGSERTLRTQAQVTCDGQGRPLRMLGTVQDVTEPLQVEARLRGLLGELRDQVQDRTASLDELSAELAREVARRREIEAGLRESERRYRTLLDLAGDAILIADAAGAILDGNRQAERLLGYGSDELLQLTLADLHPPEELPRALADFEQALESGHVVHEGQLLRRDGGRVAVEISATRMDIDGQPVMQGIIRDVTARRQAEAQLRESEARLQAILDFSPSVIFVTDLEGRYLLVNRMWESLTGVAREQAVGRRAEDFFPPQTAAHFQANEAEVLRTGRAQTFEESASLDGEPRTFVSTKFPLRKADGTVYALCGIATDISSRVEAERARLAFAERQRHALVREVHHRIKNNLQGVVGLLRHQAGRAPAARKALEEAVAQVQSIALVHGLQARADSLQLRLCDMVTEIARTAGEMARCPAPRVERILQRPVEVVPEDAVPVALILNELMANALKHRAGGGEVVVQLARDARGACVVVRNPGQPPAGFGFPCRNCAGSGLRLIEALLPPQGARLRIESQDGAVTATLCLGPPVLATA